MKILSLFDSPPQAVAVDVSLSLDSENPVQNKAIAEALEQKIQTINGMEAGQVMKAAEVDADGTPTVWTGSDCVTSVNNQSGDITISAASIGAMPNSVVVLHPRLLITAEMGSTISVNDGWLTYETEESDGLWTFELPDYGTYTINAQLDDKTETIIVNVDEVKQYRVTVTYLMPTFADNTWEQIIWACENDCVPETWVVGDIKPMTIDVPATSSAEATTKDYNVVIIGKYHDEYASGGIAPLTLMFNEVYATATKWNPLVGATGTTTVVNCGNWYGWVTSFVRGIYLPRIEALMPEEVQKGLKYVRKLSASSGSAGTIVSSEDKLFLPAASEIYDSDPYSFAGEGEMYEFFQTAANRILYSYAADGTATKRGWHTRSIPNYSTTANKFLYYWIVINTSGVTDDVDINASYYVAPAFCF